MLITSLRWALAHFTGFFPPHNADIDEKEECHQEELPKLPKALDVTRKLHLLASSQHPELH